MLTSSMTTYCVSWDFDDNLFNMFMYSMGGIVIAIIMLGSIFLIYNSFNMSPNERTQQFGILPSVGSHGKSSCAIRYCLKGFCIGMILASQSVLVVGIISTDWSFPLFPKSLASILLPGCSSD